MKYGTYRWFFHGTQKNHRISNFLLHQIAYFCGQYIKKKPLKKLYFSGFHDFSFCKSGATGNRNLMISGWISLMYPLAKEVISRYCSTGGLQYFAVSCGVDFLLYGKGNALFWNTSRCLMFLLHLGVGFIFLYQFITMTLGFPV